MSNVNSHTVLNALIKHDTLTINDLAKEENLGIASTPEEVQLIVDDLEEGGFVVTLDNVLPATCSITDEGIKENSRLKTQA